MRENVSVIITAFKEPKTIGKAVSSVLEQSVANEIIVIAPDEPTLNEAKKLNVKILKTIKDEGEGKPAALNLAVRAAKGDILILTDGDVFVGKNSLKPLVQKMQNPKIGAVSGNPISLNSRNKMLGYWANLLTAIADERRKKALSNGKRFFCSGYLFSIRKNLFPKLEKNLLSEDGYISHNVYEKGFGIYYSENSKVFVKYPTNISDWIKQKKRSAGGYNQIKKITGVEIRSFRKESFGGFQILKYARNIKEIIWLIILFIMRIYLWILIYKDINLRKKTHKEVWQRVESTK
jgi:cellulose synthase/poly-beta-1,6-N-acetylglucosamine synthase-like glycosyltransferase